MENGILSYVSGFTFRSWPVCFGSLPLEFFLGLRTVDSFLWTGKSLGERHGYTIICDRDHEQDEGELGIKAVIL